MTPPTPATPPATPPATTATTTATTPRTLGSVYIASLVVGCGAVCWVALRLERSLPEGVNGVRTASVEEPAHA